MTKNMPTIVRNAIKRIYDDIMTIQHVADSTSRMSEKAICQSMIDNSIQTLEWLYFCAEDIEND